MTAVDDTHLEARAVLPSLDPDTDPRVASPAPLPDGLLRQVGDSGGPDELRVLYVLKRYPRLSETFIVRELLGLESHGVRVGVDALLEPEAGAQHPDVQSVQAAVRYLPRKPRWNGSLVAAHLRVGLRHPVQWSRRAVRARRHGGWRRFQQAGLVADRVRRDGFQHVHAHFATAAAEVARDAAALAGVSFSVTAHAKDIFHVDNADRLPERLGEATTVVTVSHYNVKHLREELPGRRVRYVPNGLPMPDAVAPSPDGPVLCVARLVPKKGIDLLVRAMALTTSSRTLEIIGDGPCRADLEQLARDLEVSDRIVFRGPLPSTEVDAAYRRCALLALPCRIDPDGDRDGMPTVLIEAMARAIPVVSTDVVGLDELIATGRDGVLVPPEDAAALAAAIDDLLARPDAAAAMGAGGRTRVIGEFAPSFATAALLDVFHEATGR
jgi:colanic acid/amylovoran biosynthesis glycosyltransferase